MLSEFLYNNGINMIEGVPVLDSFGVVWTYAVMMVKLRQKLGLTVSRKMHYQRNDPELIAALLRK